MKSWFTAFDCPHIRKEWIDDQFARWGEGHPLVRSMYAETTGGAWGLAHTAHTNRTALYVRWSPRGGTTGQYRFTSDAGYVKNPVWPVGEDGAAAIMPEVVIETPFVTQTSV